MSNHRIRGYAAGIHQHIAADQGREFGGEYPSIL